ncbi:MAG: hypothetical protein P4L92_06645 [Rudaea sp.]|nr:hypothetical protein [Rudaea sp.]
MLTKTLWTDAKLVDDVFDALALCADNSNELNSINNELPQQAVLFW